MDKKLPEPFSELRSTYPDIARAYDALGDAIHQAGPLTDRERQLVKLALSIGAGLEGATHAHTRRAQEMGIRPEEIKHVALLCATTLGLPVTVRAYTWIRDVLESE